MKYSHFFFPESFDDFYELDKETRNWQCSKCSYQAKRKDHMQNHIQARHVIADPVPCQFCNKLYKNQQVLSVHISNYHNSSDENLECSICNKSFKNRPSLRYHRLHKEECY